MLVPICPVHLESCQAMMLDQLPRLLGCYESQLDNWNPISDGVVP